MNRCILYASEAYRSDDVKSFVRGRATFNEECFGTWTMKTNVSHTDKSLCSRVTFLQMFNDIGQVVMRLRNNEKGHKCISTLYCVGCNRIARIPHVSRMWHELILNLFRDIKIELGAPADLTAAADASLPLWSDTYDGGSPETEEEDVEWQVIDGDIHPDVVGA